MTIVVSDTSPICYLLLIDQIELLPQLYGQVTIPQTGETLKRLLRTGETLKRLLRTGETLKRLLRTGETLKRLLRTVNLVLD